MANEKMLHRFLRWITLSLLVVCTGCAAFRAATGFPAPEELQQSAKQFRISEGKSTIYIYRQRQSLLGTVHAAVWLDYQKIGLLGPGEFLMAEVLPGRHWILVEDAWCLNPTTATTCGMVAVASVPSLASPGGLRRTVFTLQTQVNQPLFAELSLSGFGNIKAALAELPGERGRSLVSSSNMMSWLDFGTLASEQDDDERMYEEMVEHSHGHLEYEAAYQLGLYNGREGDWEASWEWMCRAAAQYVLAQVWLAGQYAEGREPRDLTRAHMWLALAERNGPKWVPPLREALEREMSREQISEAERLANEWQPGDCEKRRPNE